MKKCAVCGGHLEGKRRDAVYCSAACKQYAHRRRSGQISPTVGRSEAQITVPVPAVITIRQPGKPQHEQPEAPPATPILG
jgi:hypothetical protein